MFKNAMKNHFGFVDASNEEDLKAALAKFEVVEEVPSEETVELKFGDVSLEDGTVLYFPGEELTEGTKLYIDETLEEQAPEGDHTLDNGDVISVDGEGNVTAIQVAGEDGEDEIEEEDLAEEPSDVEEPVNAQVEELLEALQPIFDTIDSRLSALENSKQELANENDALKQELSQVKDSEAKAEEKATKYEKLSKSKTYTEKPANKSIASGHNGVRARLGIK